MFPSPHDSGSAYEDAAGYTPFQLAVAHGRGNCGHHPHGRVRAGHSLGLEPASGHPQKTASRAGCHPAPVCRHAGVPCMYPCGCSPRGFTAASALVISTEFCAGARLVVIPSLREADVDLFGTLGRAAKSRPTSARVQTQDRFHSTKAPPLTRVDGQLSSKNLALSSVVLLRYEISETCIWPVHSS